MVTELATRVSPRLLICCTDNPRSEAAPKTLQEKGFITEGGSERVDSDVGATSDGDGSGGGDGGDC